MMVAEVLFWLAVACGVVAASTGNRTAWALLASVGLCLSLDYTGAAFNFALWVLIDLVVILVIIHPKMTGLDCAVLALFIPAWAFYLLPDQARFLGSLAVVIAQLLLTFPGPEVGRIVGRLLAAKPDDPFDKMVFA